MYISKVSIRNYRNFANCKFEFVKGINTIIGENGSGKTNVLRAIRLLLDDNLYKYAYKIEESDFNRNLGDWRGHWIIISIEFTDLSNDEAIQSLFIHGLGNIEEDCVETATYNLYFRPKAQIRKKMSELDEGDENGLNEILEAITISDYETKFTGRSTADFNDDEVYKELVGDFKKVIFKYDLDQDKYGSNIPNQLSVSKEVSFTFIQALRDVVSDFHNNRTNPLLSLLRTQSEKINEEDFDPISTKVNELNESIEGLKDVQQIRKDIKETIKETVGQTYSPSSLSIKSNLPDEATKLLQSLRLFIGEPYEDYEGGIHELSLGGANLIYLTLKLLEYKYRKNEDTFINFLLIEEPEAHIHTHIQKTIFNKLNYEETQVIYSTHSTHVSEVSKISSMNILAKKRNHAEVYQPSKNLDYKWVNKIERYLDAVRSNLLFAKGIILVEGDAEEILIPILIKEVFGVYLDELGVSLINIRSTGFKNIALLFHEDRIKRRCSIVTDLDKALNDDDKAKNAEKVGAGRKKELDAFVKDNKFIEAFYANYTFEVDFVAADNDFEIRKLIPEIYTDVATKKKAKNELLSEDIKQYGKRVLTMAKNVGKGWFATMLGKHINHETVIPEYILEALMFAKPDIEEHILNIIEYRVLKLKEDDGDNTDLEDVLAMTEKVRSETVMKEELFSKLEDAIDSSDQLFELLEYV